MPQYYDPGLMALERLAAGFQDFGQGVAASNAGQSQLARLMAEDAQRQQNRDYARAQDEREWAYRDSQRQLADRQQRRKLDRQAQQAAQTNALSLLTQRGQATPEAIAAIVQQAPQTELSQSLVGQWMQDAMLSPQEQERRTLQNELLGEQVRQARERPAGKGWMSQATDAVNLAIQQQRLKNMQQDGGRRKLPFDNKDVATARGSLLGIAKQVDPKGETTWDILPYDHPNLTGPGSPYGSRQGSMETWITSNAMRIAANGGTRDDIEKFLRAAAAGAPPQVQGDFNAALKNPAVLAQLGWGEQQQTAPPAAQPAATQQAEPAPPLAKDRVPGKAYRNPRGDVAVWTGTGWQQ
jgi:hypothetical protein